MNTTKNDRIASFRQLVGPDVPDAHKGFWVDACGDMFDELPIGDTFVDAFKAAL